MQDDLKNYVQGLELRSLAPIEDYQERGAVEMLDDKAQSFVSNKSIVSFASSVSTKYRNDVLDATLLAQLAANKKFPDEREYINWYKHFIEVLSNIGWVVEEAEFSTFQTDEGVFEMKSAIISVLTAAFGSDFIGIITKTLDAIKNLGDDNGTIIAFKKNTQSVNKGCFQIALAVEENDTVSMRLGVFMLESSNKVTQVLFFKSSKSDTKLTYNSRKATLNADRYLVIRDAVAKKLGDEFEKNVGEIEI